MCPCSLYPTDTNVVQFAGLPYLAHLYRRGITICTGSGIGAVLSTCAQLDNWFLIWIGSDMEKTFGPILFDMIHRTIPKERYILFDTKKEGRRPDTMKMLKDIYVAFKAEGETLLSVTMRRRLLTVGVSQLSLSHRTPPATPNSCKVAKSTACTLSALSGIHKLLRFPLD